MENKHNIANLRQTIEIIVFSYVPSNNNTPSNKHHASIIHSTINKQNYYLIYNSLHLKWQQMEKIKNNFFEKFISCEILKDIL